MGKTLLQSSDFFLTPACWWVCTETHKWFHSSFVEMICLRLLEDRLMRLLSVNPIRLQNVADLCLVTNTWLHQPPFPKKVYNYNNNDDADMKVFNVIWPLQIIRSTLTVMPLRFKGIFFFIVRHSMFHLSNWRQRFYYQYYIQAVGPWHHV